jgi:hypothetical protein
MHINMTYSMTILDFYDHENNTVFMNYEYINSSGMVVPLSATNFASQIGPNSIKFNPVPFSLLGTHTF